MVLFNYATKELTAKVVYYGPGLCGKTSNLQHIYDTLPDTSKGKMLSLATKTDRTLFFDFLPIDLGNIRGMKTKIQLYTVPGQVFYDTTRKLVLKGADGVVFVADSQEPMLEANMDSFENLITNLKEQNQELSELPHVIQYNKRDMKNAMEIAKMEKHINKFGMPYFEAIAVNGDGVFETLKGVSKLVLKHLTKKYGLEVDGDRAKTSKPAPERKPPSLPPLGGKESKPELPKPQPEPPKVEPLTEPKPSPRPVPNLSSLPTERNTRRESLPQIDDSEVIELDDISPLEIEELDEMAEIANLAQDEPSPAQQAKPTKVATGELEPIRVPVNISLPTSFSGNPIQLVIDINFEDK